LPYCAKLNITGVRYNAPVMVTGENTLIMKILYFHSSTDATCIHQEFVCLVIVMSSHVLHWL